LNRFPRVDFCVWDESKRSHRLAEGCVETLEFDDAAIAYGEVAEWSIAPVLKTGVGATRPRVRIPASPLAIQSALRRQAALNFWAKIYARTNKVPLPERDRGVSTIIHGRQFRDESPIGSGLAETCWASRSFCLRTLESNSLGLCCQSVAPV